MNHGPSTDGRIWARSGNLKISLGVKILSDHRARPSQSECVELATYLATRRESDFDYIPAILEPLSRPIVPSELQSQSNVLSPRGTAQVALAIKSLAKLSIVVQTLHGTPSTPHIEAYSKTLSHLLLDIWSAVTKWVAFVLGIMGSAIGGEHKSSFVRCCANLLLAIISGAKEDPVKEEISTRRSTIDTVYILLCYEGHHAQPAWHCDVPDAPGKVCKLLELFSTCFATPSVAAAMHRVLLCTTKTTRRAIVRSLERRGEQMIFGRQGMVDGANAFRYDPGTLESLFCLIQGVTHLVESPLLWRDFHRMRFLHTYAYAIQNISELAEISKITDDGCWGMFGKCAFMLAKCATRLSPNPRTALVQLMEDGFYLRASGRFMRYARTDTTVNEVLKGLQEIIPYLYLYKPYESANLRGEAEKWIEQGKRSEPSGKATAVRAACTQLLISASSNRDVGGLCGSILHRSRSGLHMVEPQVCGGCRSVFYCINYCQHEDWRLHSKECKALQILNYAAQRNKSWVSLSVKKDQLRALSRRLNVDLPAPTKIGCSNAVADDSVPSQSFPLRCQPGTVLSSFDFFIADKDNLGHETLSMSLWLLRREVRGPWLARIQQWVDEVEADRDTTIIAEGKFRVDSQNSMVVLARAKYHAEAAEGERYTILNSIFSLVPL